MEWLLLQEGVLLLPRPLPSQLTLHPLPHPTTILPPLRWKTLACHLIPNDILARLIVPALPLFQWVLWALFPTQKACEMLDSITANWIYLQNYPNLSQPPPAFTGQYPNSGQFTSAGSSGYGQYQSAPAHPPAHGAGHPPGGHSQYQAQPYAGQASAVSGYQVGSSSLYQLNTPPFDPRQRVHLQQEATSSRAQLGGLLPLHLDIKYIWI